MRSFGHAIAVGPRIISRNDLGEKASSSMVTEKSLTRVHAVFRLLQCEFMRIVPSRSPIATAFSDP